jgi:predicted nucleic acid-binding protein
VIPVFLDTVGLLAVWDEADQWHAAAAQAFEALAATRSPLVTSDLVLIECGNAAARRPYRQEVVLLRTAMHQRGEVLTHARGI